METTEQKIPTVDGHAVDGDDMHWTVNCPTCDYEIEYTGYFDSCDINKCKKCSTRFTTSKIWLSETQYIK